MQISNKLLTFASAKRKGSGFSAVGSAHVWGARGRWFESSNPDQMKIQTADCQQFGFLLFYHIDGLLKFLQEMCGMAAIHLFEGIKNVLPMVNRQKKRLAIVPCTEEESASVEWARQKGDIWVNKTVTSLDFVETIFQIMEWNRECRYKVLGRLVNSDRGLILVFDLEEFIMFGPKKEEYVDPATGETKKRQVKYYPDFYKNRIGRYYNDYIVMHQMSLFEDTESYSDGSDLAAKPVSMDDPVKGAGSNNTFSNNAGTATDESHESLSEENSSLGTAIEKTIV